MLENGCFRGETFLLTCQVKKQRMRIIKPPGVKICCATIYTQGVILGATYTNITVRASSAEAVKPLLKNRKAFLVLGAPDFVTVYDEQCDNGGLYPNEFALYLSQALDTVAFLVTVHDDDILYVDVFDKGQRLDEYDSCPNYFSAEDDEDQPPEGGNPALLCSTFGCNNTDAVAAVLYCHDEDSPIWTFATERHLALVKLLGLPECAVGFGYRYLAQGEMPSGFTKEDFVEIGL